MSLQKMKKIFLLEIEKEKEILDTIKIIAENKRRALNIAQHRFDIRKGMNVKFTLLKTLKKKEAQDYIKNYPSGMINV